MVNAEQQEIPGTERQPKNKRIESLACELQALKEKRAKLSTKIGDTDRAIQEELKKAELTAYYWGDQVVEIKEGEDHAKVKTVKEAKKEKKGNGDDDDDDDEE